MCACPQITWSAETVKSPTTGTPFKLSWSQNQVFGEACFYALVSKWAISDLTYISFKGDSNALSSFVILYIFWELRNSCERLRGRSDGYLSWPFPQSCAWNHLCCLSKHWLNCEESMFTVMLIWVFFCCAFCSKLLISQNHLIIVSCFTSCETKDQN